MKKIRLALETGAMRFGVWLLPRFPRRLILALASGIGSVVYALDRRGRHTALENLRAAFARDHISLDQARRIARGSYQNFARTFLDLFWSAKVTKDNFHEFFEFQSDDPAAEQLALQRGAIWASPHFGNFELAGYAWSFRGVRLLIVAQDFKNAALTAIFRGLREGSGNTLISQDGAMLRLMKWLARGGHAALLTDLNIKPGKLAAAIDCFGLLTCATTLHASLAQRLHIPIIPTLCLPLPDGGYRVTATTPLQPGDFPSPAAMSQAVWNVFEKHIRDAPEAWMWMYKHWRYLPTPEPDPSYPDYANYWKVFRQLVDDTLPLSQQIPPAHLP